MSETQAKYTAVATYYDTPQAWIYAEYDRRKADLYREHGHGEEYQMKPYPKTLTWKSKPYRTWVSTLPCMVCNKPGPSDPHHVRIRGNAGVGQRPSDFFTIPLCREHHNEIHSQGNATFEQKYQVSLPFVVMMVCQEFIQDIAHLQRSD